MTVFVQGLPIVYDTGALVAAEARDLDVWALHDVVEEQPIVTSPVVTQAWRDPKRQALLARFLKTCKVDAPSQDVARLAGVLLGRSRTKDAVDALVVATALNHHASLIVTSDPEDIARLCDAADSSTAPTIYRV